MIRAISGNPGGGKSYYAVKLLGDELIETDRIIVTNIVLKPLGVIEYLAKKGRSDINFYERVVLIGNDNCRINKAEYDDDYLRAFWRFRTPDLILPEISDKEAKEGGVRPSMDTFGGRGVHYFLDEVHEFLNSREWRSVGPIILWYMAKHRHFGDDVTWITQHIPNVDSQFRSVTQEYIYCRNFGYERLKWFAKGNYFTATTYLEPFTGKQTEQEKVKYTLDKKGIGNCYYTSLANVKADTNRKARGLPVWVFYGILALFVIGLMVAGRFAPGLIGDQIKFIDPKHQEKPKFQHPTEQPAVVGTAKKFPDVVSEAEKDIAEVIEKPWHVLSIPLKESTAREAIEALKVDGVTIPDIFVSANGANNALVLTGNDLQRLMTFAEVCRRYDAETRLITVNCVVGRLVRGRGSKIGLYDLMAQSAQKSDGPLSDLLASAVYDFSSGIATFGTTIAARELLKVVTDFQASNARFEVVSRPTLTVVAGQPGEFRTGREIPIATTSVNNVAAQTSIQYKQAEFSFEVVPTLRPDGWVRLSIKQSNSDVLSTTEIDGSPVPTLSTQGLKTLIDLNPLQVAYLGGIRIRTSRKDRRGVPVLRDIPGLDLVFGTRETDEEVSELVILVSVDVHGRSEAPARVLKALPVSQHSPRDLWAVDTATLSDVAASGTHNGQTHGQKPKESTERK